MMLKFPQGWRKNSDISWRASTWQLRRYGLGGMKLSRLDEEARTKAGIAPGKSGLLVDHVGMYAPHNVAQRAGLLKGDILLSWDGKASFSSETDLLYYAITEKKAGDKVSLELLRKGRTMTVTMTLPPRK